MGISVCRYCVGAGLVEFVNAVLVSCSASKLLYSMVI